QVGPLTTSGLSFSGQNGRANSVQIDGVDNNDTVSNGVRPTISQEAVREFQINRNGYNAEVGRASGGVITSSRKAARISFMETSITICGRRGSTRVTPSQPRCGRIRPSSATSPDSPSAGRSRETGPSSLRPTRD